MLSVVIKMCRPPHGAIQGLRFKRKPKTGSNKAQMKFSDKRMAPLGLLATSLARHPGNIDFDQTTHGGIRILPKIKPGGGIMKIPIEIWVGCIRQLHFLGQHAPRHCWKGTILHHSLWDYAEVTRLTVICHPISTRQY